MAPLKISSGQITPIFYSQLVGCYLMEICREGLKDVMENVVAG
jgi:hypothetical protein